MPLVLTTEALRKIFPKAVPGVVEAFASAEGAQWLHSAGITDSPQRLATALAHVYHETGGFTIPGLTEDIRYSAARMAQVWPNRFSDAAAVRAKYGTAPGWQKKAFDDIYGNRMGNRPGTSDGSAFIGRGGPQVTGRDGYREVGSRCGLSLEALPELACRPEHQPRVLAGFWMWKKLNALADGADPIGATVRPWNGGTNGLADRRAEYARILPIVRGLANVPDLPDAPAAPKPTPVPVPPVAPQPVPPPPAGADQAQAASALEAIAKFFSLIISAFKRK